ncbi:hypothetical protein LY76DRAFT_14940 [Colletotrichum caudatum]|nr:hypothetical protein LY76DRAFT_14940 [Colletotrichum caudatum]
MAYPIDPPSIPPTLLPLRRTHVPPSHYDAHLLTRSSRQLPRVTFPSYLTSASFHSKQILSLPRPPRPHSSPTAPASIYHPPTHPPGRPPATQPTRLAAILLLPYPCTRQDGSQSPTCRPSGLRLSVRTREWTIFNNCLLSHRRKSNHCTLFNRT